jgi:hypothetical protein
MTYKRNFTIILTFIVCLPVLVSLAFAQQASGEATPTSSNTVILDEADGLSPKVLSLAITAYNNAQKEGVDIKKPVLTIIDYSMPSDQKRLWVIDLQQNKVMLNILVAHGKNSGYMNATKFSNKPSSLETSIGLFETEGTYYGHDGYSMRIKGLDKGFNDNAESRNIVIHGAAYVSKDFAKKYGRVGNSWGCPAVNLAVVHQFIDTIKNGSLIFSYYPDPNLLSKSQLLQV